MKSDRAVLLVGHGTIADLGDVPEFLRRIRRGRPPSAELVEEIRRRYGAIGRSPLLDVTESLGRKLSACLGVATRVAMRFWDPLVETVVGELVASGVRELCVVPVAPFSVHVYTDVVARALGAAAAGGTVRLVPVEPYGSDPGLVDAQVALVKPLLAGKNPDETALLLSAHSLPSAVIASGDPYQSQFEASARAILEALGWPGDIVYQSQGADGGDWLGPTLEEAFSRVSAAGKRNVVVAPVGFLADHVETLYDLDIEARDRARARGLAFARSPALGDADALVGVLERLARRAFAASGAPLVEEAS
jgi:ferrochelatase